MGLDLTTAASDLLLGAACPGCGRPSRALCATCSDAIAPRPSVVRRRPVPVAASGAHAGVLRLVLLAWKEEGRTGMLRPLAHLLAASVAQVVGGTRHPLVLVPVPTTRRSRLARGADVVDQLARAAADLLRETELDVTVHRPLRVVRRTADQSGLGAQDRARNLSGAFALRSASGLAGRDVVVVDDVVTTGATLGEAVRALRAAAQPTVAAATVAHRPRRPLAG